jgi:hypothetical protein
MSIAATQIILQRRRSGGRQTGSAFSCEGEFANEDLVGVSAMSMLPSASVLNAIAYCAKVLFYSTTGCARLDSGLFLSRYGFGLERSVGAVCPSRCGDDIKPAWRRSHL